MVSGRAAEPGCVYQIRHRLQEPLGARRQVLYAGRAPAAAPATGIAKIHDAEQHALIDAALKATATQDPPGKPPA